MRAAAAVWLGVAAVVAAGCAGPAPPPAPDASRVEPVLAPLPDARYDGRLRVASVFPTIGRYALSGQQSENGVRLAVEDVNAAGGIHGRLVHLLAYRTGSYFVDAGHAAELAASQGQALALVGSNSSSLSMAVAGIAEARHLVQVSNVSTAQDLTWDPATGRERPFVFRVCGSDDVMGARLAEFARDDLDARRVAVLYEIGRAYSAKLARSFIDSFQAPGRATGEFFYLPLETDFTAPLAAVAAFRPDVVFVPGSFTDATLIAMQARQAGLDATLLGGDGWSNKLLFARGGPDRPAYYADHCFPREDFLQRYREAFGEEADGCRAVLGYDAAQVVLGALRALGPVSESDLLEGLADTRQRLRDVVAGLVLDGVTGPIRFDAHGDRRRGVAVMRVERRGADYVAGFFRYLGP